jgi:hypothetical protein
MSIGLQLMCAKAFGSSRIAGGRVQQILQWPGSAEEIRKIPTCLLYNERGQVLAWGLEAKVRCERICVPELIVLVY